ncbi:Cation efflux system protein CzcA [Variovorax sp. SRS16]|uniref:efflux RND transporter permease subunit n=1 Tax=Variovorax sp. SRS16 TaxID=282217 RepID=UPI0013192594|nr:CusA/CzcA family heavy metal efflux RND transporter [Variovorax sp. SRS16]VTU12788.1 Cation efflux system protein CzcA [Variovorax sp. SRS16]
MKRSIRYVLDRPLLIVLGTLLFVMVGLLAFRKLPFEVFPDASDIQVTVIALYPGHAAEEVERQVTLPIEVALSGLPHAIRVLSHTQFGLSFTVVTYNDAARVQDARQQIAERLRSVDLPSEAKADIAPNTTPAGEILRYRLRGDALSATELRSIQDWAVERQLRQVPGVADVVVMGGAIKQYEVQPDLDKLRACKLSLQQLLDALGRGNASASGSYLAQGAQQYAIRGIGLLRSADDIGRIVVSARDTTPILVRDVAHVEIGALPRLGTVGQDLDDDVVTGVVVMRRGENASVVLNNVKNKIAQLNGRGLPADVQIVPFYDRTSLMSEARATLLRNLVEAALGVSLTLCLFLWNLRASLAVAVVMPLALLAAFLGLALGGVPASLSSLGAMDFGMLVCGAAIVVENILHRLSERPGLQDRDERRRALIEATAEVGRPTLFAMLILIAAQLPILALQRQEGRLFQPMALSSGSALAAALIFSLTLVPLLAGGLLRRRLPRGDNRIAAAGQRLYAPVLDWALDHRRQVAAVALAACALALLAASRLGSEFMPELDEGSVWIHLQLPSSVSTAEAGRMLHNARQALLTVPEVRTTVSKAGRPEDGTDPRTISMAEVFVDLKPHDQWRDGITKPQLIDQMDRALSALPGMAPTFSQPVRDNLLESISQTDGQIVVRVAGDDDATLRRIAESIEHEVKQVRGVSLAGFDREGHLPQLAIDIDRERAAHAGINVNDVQDMIEVALAGKPATFLWEGERKLPVAVRLPESRRTVATLGSMPIATPDGSDTPLAAVADIRETSGAMDIAREAGRRTMAVGVFIKDRDMGSVVRDMQARVARHVRLPAGYTVAWSGELENQARAMARLAVVAPVSLLLIFVLLLEVFKSLPMAALALLSVPLAMAGGCLALWISGMPLSVAAVVGFIVLAGPSALSGMLMLSAFQQLRNDGRPVVDAIREGAMGRLRTVGMTASLAAAGLLPMALSHGAGAELLRPLAVVVIGGLFTGTLLALVVLPASCLAWFAPKAAAAASAEAHAAEVVL